jgi:hypothetical protein
MSEVKIIVTAETQQAAAALQQFVQQSGSGLNSIAPVAGKATAGLAELRQGNMLLRSGMMELNSVMFLTAGTHLPQVAMGTMALRSSFMFTRAAAQLLKLSLAEVLLPVVAIAAVVGGAAMIWRQFAAEEEAAAKKTANLEDALGKLPALLEKINLLAKAGLIGPGAAGSYAEFLTGKKKLYKDANGQLVTTPGENVPETEKIYPVGENLAPYTRQTGRLIQKQLPEASMSEVQAWVQKQLAGEAGLNDTRAGELAKLNGLLEKARISAITDEIEKQIVEIHAKGQAERDELNKTVQAAGPLVSATKLREVAIAQENINLAEQNAIQAVILKGQEKIAAEQAKIDEQRVAAEKEKAAELKAMKQADLDAATEEQKQWQIRFENSYGAPFKHLADAAKINFVTLATTFEGVFNTAISSISRGITGLIEGTLTWGQALMQIGRSILDSIIQSIVQMGVRWVMTQLMMAMMGRALIAAAIASTAPMAMASTAIWAGPAVLSTIATAGASAAAAPAEILGAQLGTLAMMGFAEGGRPPVGDMVVVGERGPELFQTDVPGTIIPNRQIGTAGGGSSAGGKVGRPQVVIVNDKQELAEFMKSSTAEDITVVHVYNNRSRLGFQT